ncbi:uncharacterized protein LAESUDRAFT_718585 [Laetiporus sulphureus 93-53]|uniref:Helicase C-terminal domain-containing protein n=1 Tax=Laetiporus sulphureus 93-53 TaxID=1314785 RepID=A0A165ASS5_9APHY|nr:uncharacterized protein LAESUDRAFT_718585 [Laetiporus sulphureus 93-53]KZS99590.1 hypothetical protein LAESUDRAFT_718585 [Laetiporus sulphureus 93-53]
MKIMHHNAKMLEDDQKKNEVSWRAGGTPAETWMAATTSFIHGIDYPFVDVIIFAGLPYNFYHFIQGAARGGRGGRPCMVIVLYIPSTFKPLELGTKDTQLQQAMQDWALNTSTCRRSLISQIMDGDISTCSTLHKYEHCDVCAPSTTVTNIIHDCFQQSCAATPLLASSSSGDDDDDIDYFATFSPLDDIILNEELWNDASGAHNASPPTCTNISSSKASITALPQQPLSAAQSVGSDLAVRAAKVLWQLNNRCKQELVGKLSTAMIVLRDKCPICWAWKGCLTNKHKCFVDCRKVLKISAFISWAMGWIDWKTTYLKLSGGYKYCYACYLPMGVNSPKCHIGDFFDKNTKRCPFSDIIVLTLWVWHNDKALWKVLCTEFKLSVSMNQADYGQWLMQVETEREFIRAIKVFLWIYDLRSLQNVSV